MPIDRVSGNLPNLRGLAGGELVRRPAFEPTGPARTPALDGVKAPERAGLSFSHALEDAVLDVNDMQNAAASRVEAFVRGEDVPLHEVVLAQEEAEISFRLLLEVRDRLVRAYQEILRTPM